MRRLLCLHCCPQEWQDAEADHLRHMNFESK